MSTKAVLQYSPLPDTTIRQNIILSMKERSTFVTLFIIEWYPFRLLLFEQRLLERLLFWQTLPSLI